MFAPRIGERNLVDGNVRKLNLRGAGGDVINHYGQREVVVMSLF